MFDYIRFSNCSWPSFNLSERAKFIDEGQNLLPYYQLTNKHNPKVKFSIFYVERNGLTEWFEIKKI
uniref:Uncharacterized protein n=1 Tax=Meloidogyne hapla TaxID=6305 RepID=A0A1I8AZS4_MELHA